MNDVKTDTEIKLRLGQKIKELRILKGLTQAELGEMVGKSDNTITGWEKGKVRPDADTIGKLCGIFEVTPNEILDWPEDDDTAPQPNDFLIIDGKKIYFKDMPPQAQEDFTNQMRLLIKAYNL